MDFKRKQKVLPMSKQWPSLQLARCLPRVAYSRRQRLFPQREKQQRELKSSSTAAPCKPISWTAADSRLQSRDSQLYGKNQFYIRYQKTGTDHTLKVSPVMIHGEPIISISALKVPLCRHRYLRNCPLYLSHTAQTEKKAEKETQVTSVHGNKIVPAVVIACFTAGLMLSGGMLAQRRLKLQLEEKTARTTEKHISSTNLIFHLPT